MLRNAQRLPGTARHEVVRRRPGTAQTPSFLRSRISSASRRALRRAKQSVTGALHCIRDTPLVLTFLLAIAQSSIAAERYGLGRPISAQALAAWDIDVRADGAGLPPGRGSVQQGAQVYAQKCAACHGDNGEGRSVPGAVGGFDKLVGGAGTLNTATPVATIGSYWPYATTLFDYIRRAMPFTQPQSLTADETYAVSAYLLFLNHILAQDAVLDATSLPQVKMPNRNGFIEEDPRPDVKSAR